MYWTDEDKECIVKMDGLFSNLFGPDHCEYDYTEKTKHCVVVPGQFPLKDYQHEEWEKAIMEGKCEQSSSTPATATAPQQQRSSNAKATPLPPPAKVQHIFSSSVAHVQQLSSSVAKVVAHASTAQQQQKERSPW